MILTNIEFIVNLDESASNGVDLAGKWGTEDGLTNARRDGSQFAVCTREFAAYHAGYNVGLKVRGQLFGDVTAAQLAECAWFDEIGGAADLPMVRLTPAQLEEIEEARIGQDELEYGMVR